MVIVSAPAKIHLIGEHAVVMGHPAIIAAVGRRIYVEAEKNPEVHFSDVRFGRNNRWQLDEVKKTDREAWQLWNSCAEQKNFFPLFDFIKKSGYENYWKAIIGTALRMLDADGGISLNITKCEIPTGSGLGSSSAAAVAIAKAVAEAYGIKASNERINDIAFECEKLIHGTPSGGDNSTSCYGGLIWFRKAQPKNEIKSLREDIPHKLENFVLVYTKQPEKTTGELVQLVRDIPESMRNPKMEEIGKMAYEMREVLKRKDYRRMKEIINRTNEILSSFGLSIPETEKVASAVNELGGAAKMCGACYGGVMLTWHEQPQQVISAIRQLGFQPFQADLAVEGVRVEK